MPQFTQNLDEYILALRPSETVVAQINAVKKQLHEKFAFPFSAVSKPNILLCRFSQSEQMLPAIIKSFEAFFRSQKQLLLTLKNFGSYPTHSVYMELQTQNEVKTLVKKLRTATQKYLKPNDDLSPFFATDFHITLGRMLKPWQFEQAWLYLQHHSFFQSFVCSEAHLLQKTSSPTAEPHGFHKIKTFTMINSKILINPTLF